MLLTYMLSYKLTPRASKVSRVVLSSGCEQKQRLRQAIRRRETDRSSGFGTPFERMTGFCVVEESEEPFPVGFFGEAVAPPTSQASKR